MFMSARAKPTRSLDTILLYEKPGITRNQGMNVLYGDGRVEFNEQ